MRSFSTVAAQQNRVTPTGEIIATSLRGAWTGNRGCVHRGREIVRPWASHHWLICSLQFKGWWQEQWVPNRLTWLFFHDEAVAFAAGHRPCALCRRSAYTAYRDVISDGGSPMSFDAIDRRLHGERLESGTRQRRVHRARWSELPDGAFAMHEGRPVLVRGREIIAWSSVGYGDRSRRPRNTTAQVLTPPSTIRVLQAGYPVQIAASPG